MRKSLLALAAVAGVVLLGAGTAEARTWRHHDHGRHVGWSRGHHYGWMNHHHRPMGYYHHRRGWEGHRPHHWR